VPSYSNDNLTSTLTPVGGGTVDVSGGWFDAGDFIKFVETASYVEVVMELSARDYPAYTAPGSVADFYGEAHFGIDWLRKMWNDSTQTLLYQVGIGNGTSDGKVLGDHDIWRLPEADDAFPISAGQTSNPAYYIKYRPALRFAAGGAMLPPQLAGRLAADFALCSQVFRAKDAALADQCLLAAEHVFALANTNPSGALFTTSPTDYYGETSWHDDLELGAVELYNALAGLSAPPAGLPKTDPNFYLQEAATWAKAYLGGEAGSDTLNLYDTSALAHYELYKAIGKAGTPAGLAVTQAQLLADLKAQVDKGIALAKNDPFKFASGYGANALGDAAPHALGLGVSARFYAELSGDASYDDFAREQRDYILGNNAWGTSFIVGAGKVFPHCLQHQVANLIGSSDGKMPLVLGAMPDGPGAAADIASGDKEGYAAPQNGLGVAMNKCPGDAVDTFKVYNGASGGAYQDDVRSWPTSEPADDYVALSIPFFLQLMK
jgi:endoglucanase